VLGENNNWLAWAGGIAGGGVLLVIIFAAATPTLNRHNNKTAPSRVSGGAPIDRQDMVISAPIKRSPPKHVDALSTNARIANNRKGDENAPAGRHDATHPTGHVYQDNLVGLIEHVEPSVVRIQMETEDSSVVGSGFLVADNGTVATNAHVIEDADKGVIRFHGGQQFPITGVLLMNPEKDIALLQVAGDPSSAKPLSLAHDAPRKGERVVAFGNPLGLSFSTSEGIVSGVRTADELSDFSASLGAKTVFKGTWIQTTAPVSYGNSGGPLVNMDGQVVGLNTLTYQAVAENVNFAISAADLRDAITQAENARPISLAEANKAEPIDVIAAVAVMDNKLSAALRQDLTIRLRALHFAVAKSADISPWVLLVAIKQVTETRNAAFTVAVVLLQKESHGAVEPELHPVWGRRFLCSGINADDTKDDYQRKLTAVLKSFARKYAP